SVVIATEPPVLFTHSVKSLTEWLRYSNETYRQAVRSGEIIADRKLAALLKCEPGKHWFLIESIRRSDAFAAPLGWTEIYVLRKFAGVIDRRDHGRAPVHEQIAKMYGETIEYAQLEVFARGMPAKLAKPLGVKPGSPAMTMVRRYYGRREELFEVTVTTHPEGRYTYTMDMQRSLRPRVSAGIPAHATLPAVPHGPHTTEPHAQARGAGCSRRGSGNAPNWRKPRPTAIRRPDRFS